MSTIYLLGRPTLREVWDSWTLAEFLFELSSCFSRNAMKFEVILDFPKGFTYNWMLHSLFYYYCDKTHGGKQLREGRISFGSRLGYYSTPGGEGAPRECEAAAQTAPQSEVEMDAGAPLNAVWNPNKQDSATKFKVGFPSQLTEWCSSLTDMPRGLPSRQPWTLSGWQHHIPLSYPLAGPPVLPVGLVDEASKCVLKSTLWWEASSNAIPKRAAHDCCSTTDTKSAVIFCLEQSLLH